MTIEYFPERKSGTRILPRSVATSAGDFVLVGGQVARDEGGSIFAGGIEAHTRQTLKNVANVLAFRGLLARGRREDDGLARRRARL